MWWKRKQDEEATPHRLISSRARPKQAWRAFPAFHPSARMHARRGMSNQMADNRALTATCPTFRLDCTPITLTTTLSIPAKLTANMATCSPLLIYPLAHQGLSSRITGSPVHSGPTSSCPTALPRSTPYHSCRRGPAGNGMLHAVTIRDMAGVGATSLELFSCPKGWHVRA